MKEMVLAALAESARLITQSQNLADRVSEAARLIVEAFTRGNHLLICGNGGSAADAQHLAAEFVNRFLIERPPLPAVALSTDTSVLTSIGNDYGFQDVFAKQVKAIGRPGDVLWGLSTSGNSPNVVRALTGARNLGLSTIVMTGAEGGECRAHADVLLAVHSKSTPRIQEVHITLGHVICELVDYLLFQRPAEEAR